MVTKDWGDTAADWGYISLLKIIVFLSLRKRRTVYVDSVEHSPSIWDSVKGTKNCFCFLQDPEKEGVWYRRYSCFSCSECRQIEFLKCTNLYAGKWLFKKFEIQSSILFKLFDHNFGEERMVQWKGKSKDAKKMRSKKSKHIKKLIVSYLRSIEL